MKNNLNNGWLQIPLIVGIQQVQTKENQTITVSSMDYHLQLQIHNYKHFKDRSEFSQKYPQTPYVMGRYKIVSDKQIKVILSQNEDLLNFSQQQLNSNQDFPVFKPHNRDDCLEYYIFAYKLQFCKNHKLNQHTIRVLHQNFNFHLTKINSNLKFVKNNTLEKLLYCQHNQEKGLLTMDQKQRFLLEKDSMNFPVIGFWLKTQKNIRDIQIYQHFSQFLKQKYQKKCYFKLKQKAYFYFVRLYQQNKTIQVYLVEWQVNQTDKKQFLISKYTKSIEYDSASNKFNEKPDTCSINQQKTQSLNDSYICNFQRSIQSQENGMQFTLRQDKHKGNFETLESLINYSYLSPIKQLQTDDQNKENIFSDIHRNSPQFSTLRKNTQTQIECEYLRTKVKNQEQQINALKKVISEMQSELKVYKSSRMSTNCESNKKKSNFLYHVSSPQTSQFTLNSNKQSGNSSPKQARRLRQSDLRSNSVSRSNWLRHSSSKKLSSLSNQSSKQNSSGSKKLNSNGFQSTSGQKSQNWQEKPIDQNISDYKQPSLLNNRYLNDQNEQYGQRDQNLYNQLPRIVEEDTRDPWDYMQIVED